ncbi:MAG: MMPL family transporter [SAR202 cluster bacterium]|nr:MMPL family transporter [SAR202 cluster bacterium]
MFEKLGIFIVRRGKSVLATFIVAVIASGAIGSLVFSRLDSGGYSDPNSDSVAAAKYLTDTFKVNDPAIVLAIDAKKDLRDPTVISTAQLIEEEIATYNGVAKVLSYWSAGQSPALASADNQIAYLFVYTVESDPTRSTDLAKQIVRNFDGEYKSLDIYVGGFSTFNAAINSKISADLKLAEIISIPLTFIFLAFVFGGLVASAMPLVIGVSAILGAFFILYLISLSTDISVFALNLVTGLGLGLGIDYALLIVNRFREELNKGNSVEDSVIRTVATAGRTVFFSGVTVIITLSSLMLFPLGFLKSFGYAGVSVVSIAILSSLIPLPAILALLGRRIDKFVVRRKSLAPKEEGGWARTARYVMKRPVSVVVLSIIFLGILAAPVKDLVFSQVDSRVLPASDRSAIAAQFILDKFPGQQGNPIEIIFPGAADNILEINDYASRIINVPGIISVGKVETFGADARLSAIHSMGPRTPDAEKMIDQLREVPSPDGTLIGGVAADYADGQNALASTLPWALTWIAIGVLVLLFLFTGSIILPIKAIILNVLSLAATMGLLTWVFIGGHLKWLVGEFTVTGTFDTSIAILIAVVAFGLSMDYELFLLSRIKEEHDAGRSNIEAVATGLQKSARIITAAAVLLAIVFASFITSGVTSIKSLGFGIAFAILLDATLVRALLVPALMRLFGERNWWAPKALRRFTINH